MSYKVMIPLDGSMTAERAVGPALELARQRGGSVVFVQVFPVGLEPPESAREYLGVRVESARATGLEASSETLTGEPFRVIVERAAEADVLVMSSHGRSGFNRLLLGSVTEKVVRLAPCPVLVVRSNQVHLDQLGRILVPLDGSKLSREALPEAARLAKATGATLVLARVVEPMPIDPLFVTIPDREEEGRAVENYLSKLAAELDPSIPVELLHEFGSPARVLVEMVELRNIDLVVMTTHGRTGFDRFVCGSVAENMLRVCHTPVFLVSARACHLTPEAVLAARSQAE
ncbi:MAG: universal stress protein [Candidatus Eremiobacteraeota bacterium]|nr:universal stress protein [Candidatus Eremiobacteraeota bacterium]